jgi:hypothetical protein
VEDPAWTTAEVDDSLARFDPDFNQLRVGQRGEIGDLTLEP